MTVWCRDAGKKPTFVKDILKIAETSLGGPCFQPMRSQARTDVVLG